MAKPKRQLTLKKGNQKFIFRYEEGQEDGVRKALIDQAKDVRTNFDLLDAALLREILNQPTLLAKQANF